MTRIALVAVLAVSACQIVDDATYKPRVGPPVPDAPVPDAPATDAALNGACPVIPGDSCGDSNPKVEVSFSRDIQPLIKRSTPGGCMIHMMMPMMPTVRLDVSTYESLRAGGVTSGRNIIIDCRPCDSILVRKLADPMPPFGARMPMDGSYWSDDQITLLRDWIAEGARNN